MKVIKAELHPLTLAIKLKNKAIKAEAHPRFITMLKMRVQKEAYKEKIENENRGVNGQ